MGGEIILRVAANNKDIDPAAGRWDALHSFVDGRWRAGFASVPRISRLIGEDERTIKGDAVMWLAGTGIAGLMASLSVERESRMDKALVGW
jgi:hypothetical protein